MSFATWHNNLPPKLLTPEEKLERIRGKFLPEPVVTWDVVYGSTTSAYLSTDGVVITYSNE